MTIDVILLYNGFSKIFSTIDSHPWFLRISFFSETIQDFAPPQAVRSQAAGRPEQLLFSYITYKIYEI
jgi:hypothetical protein